MSLAQTYRTQLAARQNRRLLVYLGLAATVHLGAVASLMMWHPGHLQSEAKTEKPPIPLDFINVAPIDRSTASPPPTERRAAVNSVAGGRHNPERSVQAGKTAPKAAPKPLLPSAPTRELPLAQTTILPHSALPNAAEQRSPQRSVRQQVPQPAVPQPLVERPSSQAEQPTTERPVSEPVSQPTQTTPPFPRAASRPVAPVTSAATQLGSPIARSIGQGSGGINGQFNPDRSGSGIGVDAVKDDLWGGYLSALNQAVDQNWQRVAVTQTRRTKIQFQVNRQGSLIDLKLMQPSGDAAADQAAMQAVQATAPFAPLPQKATEDVLIVNFTFTQWLTPASP